MGDDEHFENSSSEVEGSDAGCMKKAVTVVSHQAPSAADASVCKQDHIVHSFDADVNVFRGEWDEEGVFFYQAFKDEIANWALKHQRYGGDEFCPLRMTWIKPSFAWMLYRSGYGHKHHQNRVLKVKVPHGAVAELLGQCKCKHGGHGSLGRVQWDPARNIMAGAKGKEPNIIGGQRAIQIGLKGKLSKRYVESIISIEDVTELAHQVGLAHKCKS